MAVITTGELQKLMWIGETTYGTTPTSALTWGGDTLESKDNTDTKREYNLTSGSRSFASTNRGMMLSGFDWKGYVRATSGGYSWVNFFALNALGSTTAVTDHLPSFSSQVQIKQVIGGATTYQNFLYNGCKLNRLEIMAKSPGQAYEFNINVASRWCTYSATKAFTGLQTVTVGADAADPNAVATPVAWTTPCQYNLAGAGYINFYPRNWKLTLDNHVAPMPGQMLGADSSYYQVCGSLEEEEREITFECTLPAYGQTFQNAKRLGSLMTGIKMTIDNKVVTLGNGYFVENDFPTYKQALNDETFKIKFPIISIA